MSYSVWIVLPDRNPIEPALTEVPRLNHRPAASVAYGVLLLTVTERCPMYLTTPESPVCSERFLNLVRFGMMVWCRMYLMTPESSGRSEPFLRLVRFGVMVWYLTAPESPVCPERFRRLVRFGGMVWYLMTPESPVPPERFRRLVRFGGTALNQTHLALTSPPDLYPGYVAWSVRRLVPLTALVWHGSYGPIGSAACPQH
ncbi:hypothetical protein VSP9026_03810 [Vibrio spartinae]|uniref:Uncharacterized protein n=1 Tax=Vibrio spartinae TaxID=1918945 RepID=A0A1N6M9F2_9VIBR|nr:hypothetical protein VSP9026_03810 [Vibrio spartinae]